MAFYYTVIDAEEDCGNIYLFRYPTKEEAIDSCWKRYGELLPDIIDAGQLKIVRTRSEVADITAEVFQEAP